MVKDHKDQVKAANAYKKYLFQIGVHANRKNRPKLAFDREHRLKKAREQRSEIQKGPGEQEILDQGTQGTFGPLI